MENIVVSDAGLAEAPLESGYESPAQGPGEFAIWEEDRRRATEEDERAAARSRGKRGPYRERERDAVAKATGDLSGSDGRGRWSRVLSPQARAEAREARRSAEEERRRLRRERLLAKGVTLLGRRPASAELPEELAALPRKARRAKQQREKRAAARLAALPADRRCPGCGEVRVSSRAWAVAPDGNARCLRCHRAEERRAMAV